MSHIVSEVIGKLKTLLMLLICHVHISGRNSKWGTKVRAMQIISEFEKMQKCLRGALGYFGYENHDSCI